MALLDLFPGRIERLQAFLGQFHRLVGHPARPQRIGMRIAHHAAEGGAGTPVPDFSVEVDNLEEVLEKVQAKGLGIEYGPADEPWGVRRFYVRDPFGRLVNILQHA